MKEVKLNEQINNIDIDVYNLDLEIGINHNSEFIIENEEQVIVNQLGKNLYISEQQNNNSKNNDIKIYSDKITNPKLKLNLYPNKEVSISIKTQGNIKISNLIAEKLYIETMTGNITLEDVDIILSKLKTTTGNVKASIAQSIINYQTLLKTRTSDINKRSIENTIGNIITPTRCFEVESIMGNVDIVFKGKSKTLK